MVHPLPHDGEENQKHESTDGNNRHLNNTTVHMEPYSGDRWCELQFGAPGWGGLLCASAKLIDKDKPGGGLALPKPISNNGLRTKGPKHAGAPHSLLATVRLGVSGFGYHMFAPLIPVVYAWTRCMDSVHRHSHGNGKREAGDCVPRGVHKHCYLHRNSSPVDPCLSESPSEKIVFFSPTHLCLYCNSLFFFSSL